MEKKKKEKKNIVFLIAAFVFAVAFLVSAIMLIRELRQSEKEADTFHELSALKAPRDESRSRPTARPAATKKPTQTNIVIGENGEEGIDPPAKEPLAKGTGDGSAAEEQAEPTRLERYLPIYERNHDFFAWITIPDTNVDYPVMYSPDRPLQYLGHDFDGNFSYSGVPFVDSDCDPNGSYYLVYGHQMRNGAMFGGLKKYEDKSYWETHSTLYFDTLYEERTYEVIVAMRTRVLDREEKGFRYYNYTSLDTEEQFNDYMKHVKAMALYDTGIDASFGDELLVLSTCDSYTSGGRFVVIAKRVA